MRGRARARARRTRSTRSSTATGSGSPATRSAPADYSLVPAPNNTDPDPLAKNAGFRAYTGRDLDPRGPLLADSMQVNVRGGMHYEFSFLPGNTLPYSFGTATLRGIHMVARLRRER